jgi:pyruvate formate lyase activating enzyme
MNLKIKALIECSFLDWDGKIAAVLFVPGCNFACSYCQNWKLIKEPEKFKDISFEEIKTRLLDRKDFIDGICLSGGEPTLYKDLPEFIAKLKELGFKIKLDTNGSNPELLEKLLDTKLVDYIALDLKAPFHKYNLVAGVTVELEKIKKSISCLLSSSIDYEFRTTVVPTLLEGKDILEIAKLIKVSKRYVLQQFERKNALDEKLRTVLPYSVETLKSFAELAKKFVKEVKLRGV